MEDYEMDVVIGKGPSARTVKVPLPKFTLIGATTRPGLLTNPLRDRFGLQMNFEFYTPDDLQQIITRSADILKVPIDTDGARKSHCGGGARYAPDREPSAETGTRLRPGTSGW